MLLHMVMFRDATKPRQALEPVQTNETRWPHANNGTHAMPMQPPPPVDRFGSDNVKPTP
jgi:hypothetical protein